MLEMVLTSITNPIETALKVETVRPFFPSPQHTLHLGSITIRSAMRALDSFSKVQPSLTMIVRVRNTCTKKEPKDPSGFDRLRLAEYLRLWCYIPNSGVLMGQVVLCAIISYSNQSVCVFPALHRQSIICPDTGRERP